ncbi:arylamine N-acetyltransferase 2 [Beauveria brongniartii RCEF 3172]|uniref:Arylamine N-acetyltransferase 2 n=1 Tax=Beauveria brongniartii RCEF 3172 TaxID=1081107 RepID=A0A166X1G6_9HYPO|nr:arylamine N-acetyltransferase 2 [Beauveria brongniartii RCEF 3172]
MEATGFRHQVSAEPTYSTYQLSSWLPRLSLPVPYRQYIDDPLEIPKTYKSLGILFKSQISVLPYENPTVHYSTTHLVNIKPDVLYRKMMQDPSRGRGGYCMELSIFFHHMLHGLGFRVTMTGVRNRTRTDGIPNGEYQG